MTERLKWTFLGKIIGTATGWDGDMELFTLYSFRPIEGLQIPSGDLNIDITKGLFEVFDDDGTMLGQYNILETLK